MQQFLSLQPFAPRTCAQPTRLHFAASGLEKASTSLRITQSAFVPSRTMFNTKTTMKLMTKALFQNIQIIILHALFLNQRSCFGKRRLENQSRSSKYLCSINKCFLGEFVVFLKKTPNLFDAFQCSSEVAFVLATCRVHCFVFLSFSSTAECDIHSTESNIQFNGNPSFSLQN